MKKISLSMAALFAILVLLTEGSVMAQKAAVAPAAESQQVITTDDEPAPVVALAQTAVPVQTVVPAQTVPPARIVQPAAPRQVYPYPYGYAYPQQHQHQYQPHNNRGGRPVTFQEYFGFDGIPFNGSHIQAFRRYHGRGF